MLLCIAACRLWPPHRTRPFAGQRWPRSQGIDRSRHAPLGHGQAGAEGGALGGLQARPGALCAGAGEAAHLSGIDLHLCKHTEICSWLLIHCPADHIPGDWDRSLKRELPFLGLVTEMQLQEVLSICTIITPSPQNICFAWKKRTKNPETF